MAEFVRVPGDQRSQSLNNTATFEALDAVTLHAISSEHGVVLLELLLVTVGVDSVSQTFVVVERLNRMHSEGQHDEGQTEGERDMHREDKI